jgi:molecular chaperone IbpA
MTKQMADLQKVLLGFDRFVNDANTMASAFDTSSYPRFNILRVGDYGYRIEIAIPGWNKKDVDISLHKGVLTVEGTCKQQAGQDETYIYKGLSGKTFTKTFGVSEHVKLDRAYMERGLLCIDLHEEIPQEDRPVKVEIF